MDDGFSCRNNVVFKAPERKFCGLNWNAVWPTFCVLLRGVTKRMTEPLEEISRDYCRVSPKGGEAVWYDDGMMMV
jgi:hypothetical protein